MVWPTRYVAGIALAALALVLAVVLSAAPGRTPQPAVVSQPIVLLSGRDDHGLLAQPLVTLADAPQSSRVVGQMRDGTFVRVLDQRGDWLRVQDIAAPQQVGWVNDFYLRDRALRADDGGQVRFAGARVAGGQLEIAVRPIDRADATPVWVTAELLHEVGAQRAYNPMLQR